MDDLTTTVCRYYRQRFFVIADHGEDISCHDKGYVDGQNHPFSQGTYDRCGQDYYQGFIKGCISVEGNDRDICESATDA